MSKQEVILCESLETSLGRAIERCPHDKLFILTDEHTQRLCLPSLKEVSFLKDAVEICIGAEDVHKTLETLASVWMALSQQGATRHSLLINLGGGHGYRFGRLCRRYLQTGDFLYQYTHYTVGYGRRIRRR